MMNYEKIYTDSFLHPGRLHLFSFRDLDLFSEKSGSEWILDEGEHAASYQKHYLMISNDKDTLVCGSLFMKAHPAKRQKKQMRM